MAGCKTFQPVAKPAAFTLPDRFSVDSDTASIADLPWATFFQGGDLKKLIDTTLYNNLDLQIVLQNVDVLAAQYYQTAGPLHPSVSGVASVVSEKYGRYTPEGKTNRNNQLSTSYFLGLQSAWELDIWKRLRNQRKAAYLRVLASESGVRLVRTMLVAEVAKRYYALVSLDQKLAIIRKNIQLQQSAVDIVAVRKEGGRATELAVQQFQAQLLNTKSLEVQIQKEIQQVEN